LKIYTFSGTGNSLKAAYDIAAACSGCVIPIGTTPVQIADEDAVGFVFPCYYSSLPNAVERFIRDSQFGADYFFTAITYGGMPCHNAVAEVNALLLEKGLKLDFGVPVRAYPNYVCKYPMLPIRKTSVKKQDKQVARIALAIKRRVRSDIPEFKQVPENIRAIRDSFSDMDKQFFVTADCVNCALCVKLCPVENIVIKDGKPQFSHRCEQCMACVQWCSKRAINTAKTAKRGRYTHPAITVDDISAFRCFSATNF
jgi:ferredoxin